IFDRAAQADCRVAHVRCAHGPLARAEAGPRPDGHTQCRAGAAVSGAAFDGTDRPDRTLIDACVHCGFCLPACPTYALWGEEMESPRGRIYLMKAAHDARMPISDALVAHFDGCLGCQACVTACPSGVQYGPLLEATRSQIERHHHRPRLERWTRAVAFA